MLDDIISLKDIKIGESMTVHGVDEKISAARRLRELGFTEGARADKLYVGFGGSPTAVRISGAVIAVRTEDAARITGVKTKGE